MRVNKCLKPAVQFSPSIVSQQSLANYLSIAVGSSLTYVYIPTKIKAMIKRRTTVWLPEDLIRRLKKLSSTTGAPMAELFRRAVTEYVKKKKRATA
jgi:hypothetical protein